MDQIVCSLDPTVSELAGDMALAGARCLVHDMWQENTAEHMVWISSITMSIGAVLFSSSGFYYL